MSPDLDLDDSRIQTIIGVMIVLTIGAAVLGGVASDVGFSVTDEYHDASGDTIQIKSGADDPALSDSAGNQLAYGSGPGYLSVGDDGDVGDGNTTILVWPALHPSALQSDDYHVANLGDGPAASIQYRNGSWYGYYNKTNGGVAEVTTAAPQPEFRSQVGLRANGTHLAIVYEGQIRNATAFSDGDATPPPARNWWGTQDELQVRGVPLNETRLSAVKSDPMGPVVQDRMTLRLMLDEGSGSQTYAVVPGIQADLVGDTGWSRHGLEPTQFGPGNYSYDSETGVISIAEGSRLDALRAVYLTYDASEDQPIAGIFSRLEVIALVMFLMLAVAVIAVKEEFV